MADYRIDELARLAGTTVRNVRVYQDRGLLSPPRREGRVGYYTEAHLARLRLIGQLLKRGYTFANISELISVWERGGDLNDILGFESAVGDPWSDEIPSYVSLDELNAMFHGDVTDRNIARAVRLGLLERDGSRFRAPSPRLLNAGAELAASGISVDTVLNIAERLQGHVDAAAGEVVHTISDHILHTYAHGGMLKGEDIAAAADLVRRLRPLAQTAVDAMLADSMARHMQDAMGEHFAEVLDHLQQDHEREQAGEDAGSAESASAGEPDGEQDPAARPA